MSAPVITVTELAICSIGVGMVVGLTTIVGSGTDAEMDGCAMAGAKAPGRRRDANVVEASQRRARALQPGFAEDVMV